MVCSLRFTFVFWGYTKAEWGKYKCVFVCVRVHVCCVLRCIITVQLLESVITVLVNLNINHMNVWLFSERIYFFLHAEHQYSGTGGKTLQTLFPKALSCLHGISLWPNLVFLLVHQPCIHAYRHFISRIASLCVAIFCPKEASLLGSL